MHRHDWQPIFGWSARYRCTACKVIGYRNLNKARMDATETAIVPFKCDAKVNGTACGDDAVDVEKHRQRCKLHA